MTRHYQGLIILMALGGAVLLAGCSAHTGVRLEMKYDSVQDYPKIFVVTEPQNKVINFVYYEGKLRPWAFWNISFYLFCPDVCEVEMLVTPEWLHTHDKEWLITEEDEQYFNDWILKDRLADWFAPDPVNYEVWSPTTAEHKRPLVFVDKRPRSDNLIHIFTRNHVFRRPVDHCSSLGTR